MNDMSIDTVDIISSSFDLVEDLMYSRSGAMTGECNAREWEIAVVIALKNR
jgi:hypothetical protein